MYVIKRDGRRQAMQFDKITARIRKLCSGLDEEYIDPSYIALKVIEGIYDGVTTTELDALAAEICAALTCSHPDYALLASRIAVSNLHKNSSSSFSQTVADLYHYQDPKTGKPAALIAEQVYAIVQAHGKQLDECIDYAQDYQYDYFGFKTLERSYLLKIAGKPVERPQQMLMRVAIGIHKEDIAAAIETYRYMSAKWFTHATPTLFNAGTPNPQMSSCFLVQMKDDSIDGIFDTLKACAKISQAAGGIGISIHNIRATGSYIKGTGGTSNGILPMLRVFNDTARYIDQGGGKRKGSFAFFLEPWHADIHYFLELRKNTGKEELRARDLFTALWIPDLFMRRVEENGLWSLFCPNEAPGLDACCGAAFDKLYAEYEQAGKARKTIKAQDLWFKILESQIETGTPYMLFKDACNLKSNQQNLGLIRTSNLCAEILEYSSPDEIAVCNLASLALPQFVVDGKFCYQRLEKAVSTVTRNLDKIIDGNFYPVEEAEHSNLRHRPIGIGVQGLADLFILLRLPFESEGARQLNKEVFEAIYYFAMKTSVALAREKGSYPSFAGSPLSKGLFQFDLWGIAPGNRWNWEDLRKDLLRYGARNSLLTALMPTASTSQILGNNECFEPYVSNIYSRRVLSGEFIIVNRHLLRDLIALGLWNEQLKEQIFLHNGSIQDIPGIPEEIKMLYKTAWELKQKALIDLAAERAPFICQTQSLNLFMENPTFAKLTSMHFYAWKKGLKTGMYYLRSKAAAEAIKFTVKLPENAACKLEEGCLSCSG